MYLGFARNRAPVIWTLPYTGPWIGAHLTYAESLTSAGQAGDSDDQLGRLDGLGKVNLKT